MGSFSLPQFLFAPFPASLEASCNLAPSEVPATPSDNNTASANRHAPPGWGCSAGARGNRPAAGGACASGSQALPCIRLGPQTPGGAHDVPAPAELSPAAAALALSSGPQGLLGPVPLEAPANVTTCVHITFQVGPSRG
ncbi:hypothetical protein H920_18720 [Fukomys damarensis]|uniref:Uncharacterized protein n=1 Tax=Fukomys damarensis TaxID=885580 RepID=A0A091CQC8_FUKDA|nr:hypothetical protein H920_18720 [Fukomys damarensis]